MISMSVFLSRGRYKWKTLHTTLIRMSSSSQKQSLLERSNFKYFLPIQSRWADNDQYGHVNNIKYYSYFDTVINHYLIKHCKLNTNLKTTDLIGLMVETECSFHRPLSFPEVVLSGLSVTKIGNSSVHYKIGLFAETDDSQRMLSGGSFNEEDFSSHKREACAVGKCIHVFVNPKKNNESVPIPNEMRIPLEKLLIDNYVSKL
ncbi:uncharacterized protein [Antedon mediterranea]|uniref:uncharacterized protein n=1 Tax=Antedon mediterranea TaxID=105859 RepID=UPI003AF62453